MVPTVTWNPLDPELNYAMEHGALGFGFAMTIRFLLPGFLQPWIAGSVIAILIVKEAYWDPRHEPKPRSDFWPGGAIDLMWYTVGATMGTAIP